MNRDFEIHMTTGKILNVLFTITLGLLTGNFSLASVRALLKSVVASGKIRSHYENYPEDHAALKGWIEKAENLWQRAGATMQ